MHAQLWLCAQREKTGRRFRSKSMQLPGWFFLRILRKSVFISQGNSHAKMRKLALSWNPTGIFFTKRYLFCFESMLRLQNGKKVENRNPFSFNLTPVKSLRGEKHKIQLKNDHVSWTWFQEKCSKVKKPSFRNARTPAGFRLLQSEDFVTFSWIPSRNATFRLNRFA